MSAGNKPREVAASADAPSTQSELAAPRVVVGSLVEALIQDKTRRRVAELTSLPIGTEPQDLSLILSTVLERHEALGPERQSIMERALSTYRAIGKSLESPRVQSRVEEELETFLATGDNLSLIEPHASGEPPLTYVNRQVVTASGKIDIEARKGEQPVTVELKAREFDVTETIAQLTKYLTDRSSDRLIFVAPKIPATLYFNLKPFVDSGRLSFVEVRGQKGDYQFRPVLSSEFTREAMEQELRRAAARKSKPKAGLVRVLNTGTPVRSAQAGSRETKENPKEQKIGAEETVSDKAVEQTNKTDPATSPAQEPQPPEALFPNNPDELVTDPAVAEVCLTPFKLGGSFEERRLVLGSVSESVSNQAAWDAINKSWAEAARGVSNYLLLQECVWAQVDTGGPQLRERLDALVTAAVKQQQSSSTQAVNIGLTLSQIQVDFERGQLPGPEASFLLRCIGGHMALLVKALEKQKALEKESVPPTGQHSSLVRKAIFLTEAELALISISRIKNLAALSPQAACIYAAAVDGPVPELHEKVDADLASAAQLLRSQLVQREQIFAAVCEVLKGARPESPSHLEEETARTVLDTCLARVQITGKQLREVERQNFPYKLVDAVFCVKELAALTNDSAENIRLKVSTIFGKAERGAKADEVSPAPPRIDEDLLRHVCPETAAHYLIGFTSWQARAMQDTACRLAARLVSVLSNNSDRGLLSVSEHVPEDLRERLMRVFFYDGVSGITATMEQRLHVLAAIEPRLAVEYILGRGEGPGSFTPVDAMPASELESYVGQEQELFGRILTNLQRKCAASDSLFTHERPIEAIPGDALRASIGVPATIGQAKGKSSRSKEAFEKDVSQSTKELATALSSALRVALSLKGRAPHTIQELTQVLGEFVPKAPLSSLPPQPGLARPHEIPSYLNAAFTGVLLKSSGNPAETTKVLAQMLSKVALAQFQRAATYDQLAEKPTRQSLGSRPSLVSIFGQQAVVATAAERYLVYRAAAIRLLASISPERAKAYLSFKPETSEIFWPAGLAAARSAVPSIDEQLTQGDRFSARIYEGMLKADFRLVMQLVDDTRAELYGREDLNVHVSERQDSRFPNALPRSLFPQNAGLLRDDHETFRTCLAPFIERRALAERQMVLRSCSLWAKPNSRLYGTKSYEIRLRAVSLLQEFAKAEEQSASYALAAIRTLAIGLARESVDALGKVTVDLQKDCGFGRALESVPADQAHFLIDNWDARQRLLIWNQRIIGKRLSQDSLSSDSSLSTDTTENSSLAKEWQDTRALLTEILDSALQATALERIYGLAEIDARAACIYECGFTHLSVLPEAKTDGLLRTEAALLQSAQEDQLFQSIAEVLSDGLEGGVPNSSGEREVSSAAIEERIAHIPAERLILIDLERLNSSGRSRKLTAYEKQLIELDTCSTRDLLRIAAELELLMALEAEEVKPLLLITDQSTLRCYSPEISERFLNYQLETRRDFYRYHAHHSWEYELKAIAQEYRRGDGMPRDERIDEALRTGLRKVMSAFAQAQLCERVYLQHSVLSQIDTEVALQYVLGTGLLSSPLEGAAQVISCERALLTKILGDLQARALPENSLVKQEVEPSSLTGAEVCRRLNIESSPGAAALELVRGGHKDRLSRIADLHQKALGAVQEIAGPLGSEIIQVTPKATRNRGNPESVLGLLFPEHELEERLQLCLDGVSSALGESTSAALQKMKTTVASCRKGIAQIAGLAVPVAENDSGTDRERLVRSQHAQFVIEQVMLYRSESAEMLEIVDPQAARAYLNFTLWDADRLNPKALSEMRDQTPSLTSAVSHGDLSTAEVLKYYLTVDRKLFEHLLSEAQLKASHAARYGASESQNGHVTKETPPMEKLAAALLSSGTVTLTSGPVFDAAQRLLAGCREKHVRDEELVSMAKAIRSYKLAQTIGTSHGLTVFQAEIFLLGLAQDMIAQEKVPNESEIGERYSRASFRKPPA